MAEAKVKRWGNSLGIILPKDLVKIEDLNKGDTVKIEVAKEKRVNGFGMFKGIPKFKEEKEEHEEFW